MHNRGERGKIALFAVLHSLTVTADSYLTSYSQEYELHIEEGNLLFAGVDYEMILREAEKEADIVIWDGGNNDFSFFR